MLELKRLRRAKSDAFQIVHSECPACGGASGCPRCLDRSGMAHSGGERMEAMDSYLRAIEAEESLIGDSRRAADNRLEVTAATRRVLAKMGNVMKEDVETMLDDYAVSLPSLVARALNGQPTELPQFAQQIREEFAKMLAQTASSISGEETKSGRVDITGERSTL